jgi:ABC-type multidrug transport system ATPase subunit
MDTLELVGLASRYKSKVKTFSHGMKQRLGIAQALLHDPELIILDEPTTGLDPQGMKEIRDLIMQLSKSEGKTIFLSSHILSEVEMVANRMIIINKGKTVVEGNVNELLNTKTIKVTFEVDDVNGAIKVLENTNWSKKIISVSGNQLIFLIDDDVISKLNKFLVEQEILVKAIIPSRSLEEYFLKITSDTE